MTPTDRGLSILRSSGCAPESDAAAKSLVEEIQAVAGPRASYTPVLRRPIFDAIGDHLSPRDKHYVLDRLEDAGLFICSHHAGEE